MTQPCLCCLTCPYLISLGGVLARLLEHPTISSVTLVEIDQRVVAASRRFFGFGPPPEPPSPRSTNPAWGVFGWAGFADNSECRAGRAGRVLPAPPGWGDGNEAVDGRVRLVLADGTAWVAAQPALPAEERYDVVVVDSTDFVLSSGGGSSWTADFYRSAPHSPGGLPASTAVPIAARPPQPFQSPHGLHRRSNRRTASTAVPIAARGRHPGSGVCSALADKLMAPAGVLVGNVDTPFLSAQVSAWSAETAPSPTRGGVTHSPMPSH